MRQGSRMKLEKEEGRKKGKKLGGG